MVGTTTLRPISQMKSEAQKGRVICPRSHNYQRAKVKLRSLAVGGPRRFPGLLGRRLSGAVNPCLPAPHTDRPPSGRLCGQRAVSRGEGCPTGHPHQCLLNGLCAARIFSPTEKRHPLEQADKRLPDASIGISKSILNSPGGTEPFPSLHSPGTQH